MNWVFTPFAVPLFVGALALVILIAWAWPRRRIPGATYLILLCVALIFYAVGYAFELGSLSLADVRLWFKVEYLGIPFLPGLLICLIIDYLGYRRWLNPIMLSALFFIPVITLVLAWTNDSHQLLWQNITIDRSVGFTLTSFDRGLWYYVHNVFVYLEVLASLVIAIRAFLRATGLFRRQLIILVIAVLFPTIVHILYIGKVVFPGLDLNPYAQLLVAGLVGWGILNYRLLDVTPIAQETVVQSMADAVLVFDAQNRLLSANPAAFNLFDTTLPSTGKAFARLFPEWPDLLAAAGSKQSAHEALPLTVNHVERFFNVISTPLAAQSGRPGGNVVVARDVTAEVRATQALVKANKQLEALRTFDADLSHKLSIKHVATVGIDAAMRLSGADAALLTQHGVDGFRVLQGLGGYASQKSGTLLEGKTGIMARVVRTRQPDLTPDVVSDPDYVAINPTTRAQITFPLISGDKLLGVLVLETTDPTRFSAEVLEATRLLAARIAIALDNALIYEERDDLVRELDAFAHTVAHDLKNPLGIMRGYAEMLLSVEIPETGRMYAERIRQGATESFEIIEALLLLAGASALEETKIGEVVMGDTVKSALGRLAPLIDERGANVTEPSQWPNVHGYGPWVEELWANYISNALKYGGMPPQITLGWDKQPDGRLRFWTQDNGRGLTPDEIRQLFRPFVRLENTSGDGHGLGLSIVQRIATRLGGSVGVESTPGKGSKFYFTMPPAKN